MRNSMTFYDIKGNSFKNTLIPKQTANSALRMQSSGATHTSLVDAQNIYLQDNRVMKIKKNKPNYKGYIRSGAILFNNINQHNTKDAKTPKARRRNDNSLPAQSDVFTSSSG